MGKIKCNIIRKNLVKFILQKLILLSFTSQAQLPLINGWTQFIPSSDSRIIYVSSSSGNDLTAQIYSSASPQVGTDPFNPVGIINAYQTLSAAATQLRNGFADWILFRRGDTFTNQFFGSTTMYGRNRSEPMLIGSYGTASQRPLILTGNQTFIDLSGSNASNIAIVGLHIEPHTRSGTDEPVGIRIISAPFDNILIEDCYIVKYFQNLSVHDPLLPNYPTRSNLKVRRSILADAYVTSSSHANAMFIANVDSILFEENLLDHNGWSTSVSGANPTGFRHNSYFQASCRNLVFRENIVSRAAATGGGFRCGGIIYNNTFLSNPKNLQFGTHETTINWPTEFVSGEVSYNVVLDSRPESFEPGKGITIQRAKNTNIHHNIIAHFTPVSNYNLGLFFDETENITVRKNIIYKWSNNTSSGPDYSAGIAIGNTIINPNLVDSNDVQMENSKGFCIEKYGTMSNVTYSNNRYNNVVSAGDWFSPSGTFANWLSQSGETGAIMADIPYLDPERNISTYMNSLSLTGGLNDFLNQRRMLTKSNWNINFSANSINNYIRQGFDMNPISTSVSADNHNEHNVVVFPNPTSGTLTIQSFKQIDYIINILSVDGKCLHSKILHGNSLNIDISDYPPGLYLLFLKSGMQESILKIIKTE